MNSRERFGDSGNLVANQPDRPSVVDATETIYQVGDHSFVIRYRKPIFAAREVRGHTIGGGVSREALRRARRSLAGRHNIPEVKAWMENTSWAEWAQRNIKKNGH